MPQPSLTPEPVPLHYRYFGGEGNPALIIFHGLLGSSRNWTTVAKALTERYEVFAADLRNHGDSPHSPHMDYPSLIADLEHFLEERQLDRVRLMGHSLGGKVCMRFACDYPERVESLVIADIAAKDYPPHYEKIFKAMTAIDLSALKGRKEAEEALKSASSSWVFRQFLLTNLVRDRATGGFRWQCNLKTLKETVDGLAKNPLQAGDHYAGPTLLVIGGKSDFVDAVDRASMQEYFSRIRFDVLEDASHNVHVEDSEGFLAAVEAFEALDWGCGI